jgi:hypothetical protein
VVSRLDQAQLPPATSTVWQLAMCAIHTEAPFVRHLEWPIHRPAPTVGEDEVGVNFTFALRSDR